MNRLLEGDVFKGVEKEDDGNGEENLHRRGTRSKGGILVNQVRISFHLTMLMRTGGDVEHKKHVIPSLPSRTPRPFAYHTESRTIRQLTQPTANLLHLQQSFFNPSSIFLPQT